MCYILTPIFITRCHSWSYSIAHLSFSVIYVPCGKRQYGLKWKKTNHSLYSEQQQWYVSREKCERCDFVRAEWSSFQSRCASGIFQDREFRFLREVIMRQRWAASTLTINGWGHWSPNRVQQMLTKLIKFPSIMHYIRWSFLDYHGLTRSYPYHFWKSTGCRWIVLNGALKHNKWLVSRWRVTESMKLPLFPVDTSVGDVVLNKTFLTTSLPPSQWLDIWVNHIAKNV